MLGNSYFCKKENLRLKWFKKLESTLVENKHKNILPYYLIIKL